MSGARKPKPTKLKESQASKTAVFDVKQFFGKAVSLVPVQPPTPEAAAYAGLGDGLEDKTDVLPRPQTEGDSAHLSVTKVTEVKTRKSQASHLHANALPTQPFQVPSATGVTKRKSSAKWISETKSQSHAAVKPARKDEKETRSLSPLLFLFAALALFAYAFLSPSGPAQPARLSAAELQSRIDYHSKTTGWKLNGERIDVQYENLKDAPDLSAGAAKVKAPDMMQGLPLEGEKDLHSSTRDRMMPENPSYADTRIMYGLQEEQNRIEVEKRAQDMYIKEMIANAHADGYDLKIDKFGNVKAKRLPAEELDSQVPEAAGGSYGEH